MQLDGTSKRAPDLPADLEGCHTLIRELVELVERQGADIGYLKQRLHTILRERYGRSSEKLSAGQLQLFTQELEGLLEREVLLKQDNSSALKSGSATGA
jgi:hypothetical protein